MTPGIVTGILFATTAAVYYAWKFRGRDQG